MQRRVFVVLGLAVFGSTLAARVEAQIKVAAIGASTTRGSGAPAGMSYPDQLQRLLGAGYQVRNFGRNGAGALKQGDPTYWNSPEYNAATAYAPDIVINWLGGADSKTASWDRHKAEFLGDYKAMIQHFQELPARPRVISMISIALYNDAGVRKDVLEREVNPLQIQGATERGSPMIDTKMLVDGHPEYFNDGVHLKASGYAVIAKAVHTAILALPPAGDAGTADAAVSDAGAAAETAPPALDVAPPPVPTPDASPQPPPLLTDAAATPEAPATPPPRPTPPPPAASPAPASTRGCAVGAAADAPDGWLLMLLLFGAISRRRR